MSPPWPRELKISPARDNLTIAFENGERFSLAAEYLRVESPSAEVQGHGPAQKKTIPGKRGVTIAKAEPVGNYAVRLIFSDGHESGLYSWEWLHSLGREQAERWTAYQAALEAKGLSRG